MKNWLQLFRAPNLFTVPGDPLAGFLLASAGAGVFHAAIAPIILASLLFYGFGLLLNDLMDLREDRAERPSRPLPSGAVNLKTVRVVAALIAIAGLGICAHTGTKPFLYGSAIVLAVTTYNCGVKKIPLFGVINMGVCRGLNVLLGATLAPVFTASVITAALVIAVYITAVSLLARDETENPAIPPLIGKLVRGLILIQAVFCLISGGVRGWLCAAVLALALWPLSHIVGRRFYAS
jgi:4-hydroxybenzoate polyprenyltransferase